MTCTHHWVIESPNGSRTVEGTCKYCESTKLFQAGEEEAKLRLVRYPAASLRPEGKNRFDYGKLVE